MEVSDEKSLFLNSLLEEIEYNKGSLSNYEILQKCRQRLIEYAHIYQPALMELANHVNEVRIF